MANIHIVAFVLLIVGGLNWLLFALFGWEIGQIFGGMDTIISKIIYILVGLAAIFEIVMHKGNCSACRAIMGKSGGSGSSISQI